MRYKPPSIEDIGLEAYLNDTKDLHRGYGYDDFIDFIAKAGVAKTAKLFGVTRPTIYEWLKVDNKVKEDNGRTATNS